MPHQLLPSWGGPQKTSALATDSPMKGNSSQGAWLDAVPKMKPRRHLLHLLVTSAAQRAGRRGDAVTATFEPRQEWGDKQRWAQGCLQAPCAPAPTCAQPSGPPLWLPPHAPVGPQGRTLGGLLGGGDAEVGVTRAKVGGPPACAAPCVVQGGGGGGAGWGTRKPWESACQEAVTGGDFPLVSAGMGRAGGDSRGWGDRVRVSEQRGRGSVRGTGHRGDSAGGSVQGRHLPAVPGLCVCVCKGDASLLCTQMCKGGKPLPCPQMCRRACAKETLQQPQACARAEPGVGHPRCHIACVCKGDAPLHCPRCAGVHARASCASCARRTRVMGVSRDPTTPTWGI